MKTIIQRALKTVCLFSFFFSLSSAFAQAPQKMSYQAVVRNASNALVANANIRMRISVLQGTAAGTAVYVETQTTITNSNGLATVEIGAGTIVSGTFASISWGTNAYFIKTETDPTGGTNYTIVGTSQFLSVPYALFASNSGSSSSQWTTTGTNIANNNSGNVGVGTPSPAEKLDVNGKTKTTELQVTTGPGAGKVLTSDTSGNATWQTPASGTVNSSLETNVYNLSTALQNVEVDFPTTNVTVPATGTYLITYYVDAYNTFVLDCVNNCTTPKTDQTIAYIYNKSDGNLYQKQNIDFKSLDYDTTPGFSTITYRLPAHQISGSIVRQLFVNQQIGVKMQSLGNPSAASEARIRQSTITLVRLF
jgi:hypothetical protein